MQPELYLPSEYPNERAYATCRAPPTIARMPLLGLIRLYQMTVSRGLPEVRVASIPRARTTVTAIYKHGAFKGTECCMRVLRCNPFNAGATIPSHRSHHSHMKRLAILSLMAVAALTLSACGTPQRQLAGLAAMRTTPTRQRQPRLRGPSE